jgi:hypothetical protein
LKENGRYLKGEIYRGCSIFIDSYVISAKQRSPQ